MFIFFHEFDSTSMGASIVIINLVRGLTAAGEKVLLFNYVNGALHNSLGDVSPNLLEVADHDRQTLQKYADHIKSSDVIVTMHYYTAYRYFKKVNPKFIFYCVNITSLPSANQYFNRFQLQALTRCVVKASAKNRGLLFIDHYSLSETEKQLGLIIKNPDFLPIPVTVPSKNLFRERYHSKDRFVMTYVGRSVDWKIYPARKILRDAAKLAEEKSRSIEFHIVTDNALEFAEWLSDIEAPCIKICWHQNLSQDELHKFLLDTSNLHFAMGTSSLDGAKLGIPTIILDFAYNDFPQDYRYNFLFDTTGHTVGTRILPGQHFKGYTLKELVDMIEDEKECIELSEASYQYVRGNHELRQITKELIRYAEQTKMHLLTAARYLIRYWN